MIVALSGKRGTGKSTLANHLIHKAKSPVVLKIAGPIYELQDMIYEKLGLKLEGEKDRPLLIALGMWARDKDEDFWTNLAAKKAMELNQTHDLVIIDDCRFPNEAAIFDGCGMLIRIDGEQRGPNLDAESMNHITEIALDDYPFKYRINNSVSLEDTIKQLDKLMEV